MFFTSVKFIVLLLTIIVMVLAVPEGSYKRYKRQGHPSYYGRMKLSSNANVDIRNRIGRLPNNYNNYQVR